MEGQSGAYNASPFVEHTN